jgi:hypothetical protein
MRIIDNPPPAPRSGTMFTTQPAARESIAAIWSREIATAVATALNVDFEQATYRLLLRRDQQAPKSLHSRFRVAGHRVQITVVWDNHSPEPGFALAINGQPVALDRTADAKPAVVLARAAWQAITDSARPGGPATAKTATKAGVR